MVFNSFSYFIFLPLVFLTYCYCKQPFRWLVLLLGSLIFYSAVGAPHLIAVIAMTTVTTYLYGLGIGRSGNQRFRFFLLWAGISTNVLTLVVLKYVPGLSHVISSTLNRLHVHLDFSFSDPLISIGISYFIFQAISYLVDIYLEQEKAERHLGYFALYMSFFPKLLQGPIERVSDLLPQLKKPFVFDYDNVRSGMLLFAWGLMQKIVIADRLALMVNQVYDNLHVHQGFPLLLATYYYSLQIFFDFSGYTDMAIGSARIFNINLSRNFNSPYLALSIADFWRRWHISFSRWILDYIFKPLQMTWRGWGRHGAALALIVTFLVSGLWHGAKWGFVVWGLLHGVYMAASYYYKPFQKKLYRKFNIDEKSWLIKGWQVFCVFNLVSFAWIFFRCQTLSDSMYVVRNLFPGTFVTILKTSIYDAVIGKLNLSIGLGFSKVALVFAFVGIFCLLNQNLGRILQLKFIGRWGVYVFLALSLVFFGHYGKSAEFIYFKF